MYYDAHTHLNSQELYPDWKTHVQDFIAVGGKWLVTIGVWAERNQRNIAIASQWERGWASSSSSVRAFVLKCAIGYHPSEVSMDVIRDTSDIAAAVAQLKEQLAVSREHIVGIGECWTDLHYATTPAQHLLQQELFAQQCALAQAHDLPVIVHSRDDFAGTWEIIQQFSAVRFYIHCRWYTTEQIRTVYSVRPDIFVWFCGNLTYPKAQELRDSLKELVVLTWQSLPACLLLETDAPYLAPQERRGKQNKPSYLPSLYGHVAQQLGCELHELQETIQNNFKRCYSL